MQGIFGHIVQKYVSSVIPQRRTRILRQTSVSSRYYPQRQLSTLINYNAPSSSGDSVPKPPIISKRSARFTEGLQQQTSTITESSLYSSDYPDGLYEDEYSCRPPAVAMIIISIIEICLFLYDVIKHKSLSVEGPAATLFIYNPHKRYQAWRYLTYMFVHVGYVLPNICIRCRYNIETY